MKLPRFFTPPKKPNDPYFWPFVLRRVAGHSMMPILPPGTHIVGSRWFRKLKVKHVIIFEHNDKEKVKRISEIMPDGTLHVVGDHTIASTDSRHFGTVDKETVVAKVVWPRTKVKR